MSDYLRKPDPLVLDDNKATNLKRFIKCFDNFISASDAANKNEKQKCAIFLNLAGEEAIEAAENFTYAEGEDKDSLQVLKSKFKAICDPYVNVIMERFKFNSRLREPSESMSSFITTLRTLAKTCDYKQMSDEMIRDRIVIGIQCEAVTKQMLKKKDLTLNDAVEICQIYEISNKHLKDLKQSDSVDSNDVHALTNKPRQFHKSSYKALQNCINCGGSHQASRQSCPAYGKRCHACNKLNHYKSVCISSKGSSRHVQPKSHSDKHDRGSTEMHEVNVPPRDSDDESPSPSDHQIIYSLDDISKNNEINCSVSINGHDVHMKIDSGAKCNVMSFELFKKIRTSETINAQQATRLLAYGGATVHTMGTASIHGDICLSEKTCLVFHIVDRNVPTILGLQDALKYKLIQLHPAVFEVNEDESAFSRSVKQEFKSLFDDKLGKLPIKYKMTLDPAVQPVVKPPRKIPLAMEKAVQHELDRMCKLGVITPQSEPTEWVSNMVAAKKKNGDIRICIDPKDLNRAIMRPHHPMRTIEDVVARMPGAKLFSTLDAKSSFWQIRLDNESSLKTTFCTPYGRFKFLRLPFGIKSASEVYQRAMEQLFAGFPCAIVVDDILVWGATIEEHDTNLCKVLNRCQEINMKLNLSKCHFRVDSVRYVGHEITSKGLKPDSEKVKAIKDMPAPSDQAGVQRFLGVLNYLHKFIKNMSAKTAPLRELLHKDVAFIWGESQNHAFNILKNDLCSAPILKYFDPSKPVKLSADSSKSGLGACCLQDDLPVAYASRSLTPAEMNYAQIEKELLASVFACTKFHDFIYGRPAIIETDHKPLISIVKKPLHAAPPRLQRMLLQLQKYDLNFVYKCGKELYLADTLSRAYPQNNAQEEHQFEYEVMNIAESCPQIRECKIQEVSTATRADPVLSKLIQVIEQGWPDKFKRVHVNLRPFFAYRNELVVQNGVVLRGHQVVIPASLRLEFIEKAHSGHPGADRTTKRLKDVVFWPGIAEDVTKKVSQCSTCNSLSAHQQKEPMIVPPVPDLPWTNLGADIFQWHRKHYLVTVDSYSGWFEIDLLHTLGSKAVINKLKRLFATHGCPRVLTTDNGPQFNCQEFTQFAKSWDFQHVTSSPEYPQSNGLAENAVKQAEKLLESCYLDGTDYMMALLNLRNIPRDGQLKSPCQRLMSRRTRNMLPTASSLLQPSAPDNKEVHRQLIKKRLQQKKYYDKSAKPLRPLSANETVRMQTSSGYKKLAVVKRHAKGPRSYVVESNGKEYVRNRRHLLPVKESVPVHAETNEDDEIPIGNTPIILENRQPPAQEPQPVHVQNPRVYYPRNEPILMRSGRISMPNRKYYGE